VVLLSLERIAAISFYYRIKSGNLGKSGEIIPGEIWGHHTYFSILNTWLRNQAFQCRNNIKIFSILRALSGFSCLFYQAATSAAKSLFLPLQIINNQSSIINLLPYALNFFGCGSAALRNLRQKNLVNPVNPVRKKSCVLSYLTFSKINSPAAALSIL